MSGGDSSDVYLLGAGFARAISPAMPLLQDLASRVIRQRHSHLPIPVPVRVMLRDNFAHALSYLEQAKPWVSEADNLRDRALYLEFSNAIARDLDATVARVARKIRLRVPPWLAELLRHWHQNQSTVLTLNYDTLVETVAATIPVDGGPIVTQQIYPPLLTDAGLRTSAQRTRQPEPSFRLLKLHGSTNWYFSGRTETRGEPIYYVPPLPLRRLTVDEQRAHDFRMEAVADKYPLMVPPVYDKAALLTHETIRALWFAAGEALKRADRLICMGYSLPESDLTMRHFLQTAAGRGRLLVVDPSPNAEHNFKRLLSDAKIRVESYASGARSIPRFVDSHIK